MIKKFPWSLALLWDTVKAKGLSYCTPNLKAMLSDSRWPSCDPLNSTEAIRQTSERCL